MSGASPAPMRTAVFLLLVAATPLQSNAGPPLSSIGCPEPLSARSVFHLADLYPERYIPVYGAVSTLSDPAQFIGTTITRRGLDKSVTIPVTLEIVCIDAFCGTPPKGVILAFLRLDENNAATLNLGPCGVFPGIDAPTLEDVRTIQTCFLNGCSE